MVKFLKNLFSSRVDELEKEVLRLKNQLEEAQENLNKTNAYWKRKFYGLKNKPQN
jgi:hypothetical protein